MKRKKSYILFIFYYIVLLAILLAASISAQKSAKIAPITADSTWEVIKETINDAPLYTVSIIVLVLIVFGLNMADDKKYFIFIPTCYILVVFYEFNLKYAISKILVAVMGTYSWLLCLILFLYFSHKTNYVTSIGHGFLKDALKHTWEQHNWLISVQAYRVKESNDDGISIYRFSEIDHYTKDTSDINSVLSINYEIKEEYIEQFKAIINFYHLILFPSETGQQQNLRDERSINSLLQLIEADSTKIQDELSRISCIDAVSKEACCLARMLNIYQCLLKVLTPQEDAGEFNGHLGEFAFKDGDILGEEKLEIEKALFTAYRTGLLCGILLGNAGRYQFEYRKDGEKHGRCYYVSAIYPKEDREPIVCLFVCSEKIRQRDVYRKIIARLEMHITNYLANQEDI